MKHLSKLVVGTLSLAVMLVGFVPSLARAQMAIVERIDVPNNCFELFKASVTTAFSAEKTGPQERAEGTVTALGIAVMLGRAQENALARLDDGPVTLAALTPDSSSGVSDIETFLQCIKE